MKTTLRILSAALLCLALTLVLCSCSTTYPTKLVGRWQGDGTLRAAGFVSSPIPFAPFDRAQELLLQADGTGRVTSPSGSAPLTWNASDDTLTLSFVQLGSWGIPYEYRDSVLTLRTEDGPSVFKKIS